MKELTTPNDLNMLSKAWLQVGCFQFETLDQHNSMMKYIKDNYTFEDEDAVSESVYDFLYI